MNKKRAGLVIAGILLIVAGVIIFVIGMNSADITIKIGGGSIAVAGLAFFAESLKKKKDNNQEDGK